MLRSFAFSVSILILSGCSGRVADSPSSAPDASLGLDAATDGESADLDGSFAFDGSTMPPSTQSDAQAAPDADASGSDAGPHCECNNLDACCRQAAQVDNGVACRADVARADEDACRSSVLQGKYGCLALGFIPHCSPADGTLCPNGTTRCTECLTSYRNCGPVIQCVVDPACKSAWDAMVACDRQGRPFLECFNILQSGSPPGELLLYGAQCVETCQGDH